MPVGENLRTFLAEMPRANRAPLRAGHVAVTEFETDGFKAGVPSGGAGAEAIPLGLQTFEEFGFLFGKRGDLKIGARRHKKPHNRPRQEPARITPPRFLSVFYRSVSFVEV